MLKICCDRCGKDITTNHKYTIHVEYKHSITPGKVYAVPPKNLQSMKWIFVQNVMMILKSL